MGDLRLPSSLKAAQFLSRWWPDSATISPESGLPTCVESTAIVVAAFRAAGFLDVNAMSCELVSLNSAARRSIEEKREVKGSCRIEVGPNAPDIDESPGWNGHLIAEGGDFLLDVVYAGVVRALHAPGFGDVSPFCAQKNEEAQLVDGAWTAITENGSVIMYRPTPENDGWHDLPGWKNPDATLVDLLAKMLKEMAH